MKFENDIFLGCLREFGPDFDRIAERIETRSAKEIKAHFRAFKARVVNEVGVPEGDIIYKYDLDATIHWTDEEKTTFIEAVREHGRDNAKL